MEILHWSNGDVMTVPSILWTCLDDINSKYVLYESGLQGILAKQKSGSLNFPSTYFMPVKKIKINAESTPGMTSERQSKCLYLILMWMNIYSVQFSCSVVSNSVQPHGLQHTGPPCPSPAPRIYSNSCPSSQWCHPTISSSVVPFSSHLQSFPASGSFPMSQFFTSGSQSIGVSASASVLPVNIQTDFL